MSSEFKLGVYLIQDGVAKRRGIDSVGLHGELTNSDEAQPDAANVVPKALMTLLSLPEIQREREQEE